MRCGRALLVVGLWLLAFLLPELVARLFMPGWSPAQENTRTMIPDVEVGWLYKPLAETDTARNSGTYIASSLGLRNAELGIKEKPRVVFLGDSFTWGWGVPNGVRYTDYLEAMYPQYQIVNAGINGYSTVQEMLLLKKYRQKMMPDLVVLQVFHNDFIENLETQGVYAKPYLDWQQDFVLKKPSSKMTGEHWGSDALLWIANHTYFYRQIVVASYVALTKKDESGTELPSDEKILAGAMKVALETLMSYCREENMPLLIISSDLQIYQRAVLESITRERGVAYYDLTEKVFPGKKDFSLHDHAGHWNAYGHQLVANFIGPVMDEKLRVR